MRVTFDSRLSEDQINGALIAIKAYCLANGLDVFTVEVDSRIDLALREPAAIKAEAKAGLNVWTVSTRLAPPS